MELVDKPNSLQKLDFVESSVKADQGKCLITVVLLFEQNGVDSDNSAFSAANSAQMFRHATQLPLLILRSHYRTSSRSGQHTL